MLISDRDFGCRSSCGLHAAGKMMLAVVVMVGLTAGCQHPLETGFADKGKLQIQFHTPPGATVTVFDSPPRSHQIAQYGAFEHRLEHAPEQFCVFNLGPGRYEFKYVSADGLPGVSIYGELNVHHVNSHEARVFQRRSFIPIALPSEYYRRTEVIGDQIFPYRGEAYRTAIDEHDLLRLKEGDVIEKVFFVADLEDAYENRDKLEREIAACEREMEYAETRFRNAYMDYKAEADDPVANFWGTDREFIRWEKKRRKLDQKLARLQAEYKRTRALLSGDHVLIRKGMLVLTTEEIVEPYTDVVKAADDLGEVLLVMRIGGRHMHKGDPRREMAAYEP
ncbi:MAG: hypothetical protein JSV03_09060 [Planctomycetota bacterium]|nr:MAG: hypothetical protein JSV03_09060 [Planctomycetota bacterium]